MNDEFIDSVIMECEELGLLGKEAEQYLEKRLEEPGPHG